MFGFSVKNLQNGFGSPRSPTPSTIARVESSSPQTDVGEIDTRAPFESVKAAVSLFGESISPRARPVTKKTKAEEVPQLYHYIMRTTFLLHNFAIYYLLPLFFKNIIIHLWTLCNIAGMIFEFFLIKNALKLLDIFLSNLFAFLSHHSSTHYLIIWKKTITQYFFLKSCCRLRNVSS